jgi:hypothetical protein
VELTVMVLLELQMLTASGGGNQRNPFSTLFPCFHFQLRTQSEHLEDNNKSDMQFRKIVFNSAEEWSITPRRIVLNDSSH